MSRCLFFAAVALSSLSLYSSTASAGVLDVFTGKFWSQKLMPSRLAETAQSEAVVQLRTRYQHLEIKEMPWKELNGDSNHSVSDRIRVIRDAVSFNHSTFFEPTGTPTSLHLQDPATLLETWNALLFARNAFESDPSLTDLLEEYQRVTGLVSENWENEKTTFIKKIIEGDLIFAFQHLYPKLKFTQFSNYDLFRLGVGKEAHKIVGFLLEKSLVEKEWDIRDFEGDLEKEPESGNNPIPKVLSSRGSCLHRAILTDNTTLVKVLLEHPTTAAEMRFEIAPGIKGMNPLELAVWKGNLSIVKEVLEKYNPFLPINLNHNRGTLLGLTFFLDDLGHEFRSKLENENIRQKQENKELKESLFDIAHQQKHKDIYDFLIAAEKQALGNPTPSERPYSWEEQKQNRE